VTLPHVAIVAAVGIRAELFVRMLFSALVDADIVVAGNACEAVASTISLLTLQQLGVARCARGLTLLTLGNDE
jgi:hypothetical protein